MRNTPNGTSQAMKEMAKDCQKGFVILNDIPAIAEKYKRMEKALEYIASGWEEEGKALWMENSQYLAERELAFDPLSHE